jgi:hypothetical protein
LLPGPAQPYLTSGARVYSTPPALLGPTGAPITIDVTPQPVVAPAMPVRRRAVPQRAAVRALARQRRTTQLAQLDRDSHKQEG